MQKTKISRKSRALEYGALGLNIVPAHTIENGHCSCESGSRLPTPRQASDNPARRQGRDQRTMSKSTSGGRSTQTQISASQLDRSRASWCLILTLETAGLRPSNGSKKKLGPLPETVTSNTGGGGEHRIFAYPTFPVRKDDSGKLLGPGIDVLSDGCIVLAPPSRHASGNRYRWQDGKSFRDLEPAPLPEPWLNRLRGNAAAQPDADNAPAQSHKLVPEGKRNSYLTSLAGTLQRSGASPEAINAALMAENATKCMPPLGTAEVEKIVASVATYQAAPLGGGADAAEGLMQLVLNQYFNGGKHLLHGADNRFWHYDVRLWRPVSDQWIAGKVLEIIQANPIKGQKTASLIGQGLTLLKAKLAVKDDPLSFVANPPPVINCANGELWIADDGTVELRPHRPESHLRDCLDVPYDPKAESPEYDKAVCEIFSKVEKPNRMARHWNELVGYIIQPRRNVPVIVVLLGGGDNGKTVLIRTVIRLLGDQLVHAQRVEDLDKSRFAMGSLLGKRLFVDDDVKAGARLPDGTLKTISEAKEVTGELKYHQPFNFVVRTVPVLLCNNIPSLGDLSHGMRRRLMVIPFDRRFTDEDRDPALFQGIWTNELPGVLNKALAGYKRLIERKFQFKRPLPVRIATERWLQQANPLPAFIEDHCAKKADGRCLVQGFYAAYANWTQAMGYTLTQTQQTVTRNLEHLGFTTKKTNQGLAVLGLRLVDDSDD